MAFQPVPNVGSFALCYTLQGQQVQNVFHLLNDSPFDEVSLALACDVLKTWWSAGYRSNCSSAVSLVRIIARGLDSDSSPSIEYTNGLPLAGTGSSPAMPGNVTVAVKLGTSLGGRSYRGRSYFVGLQQSQVSGNQLSAGTGTTITAIYNELRDALDSTPWELVVVSRFHANAERAVGIATPIVSTYVDGNLDSQRRRLNNRGV